MDFYIYKMTYVVIDAEVDGYFIGYRMGEMRNVKVVVLTAALGSGCTDQPKLHSDGAC